MENKNKIDFTKIYTGVEPSKTVPVSVIVFEPVVNGVVVQNGCGEPLVLNLLSLTSPEGRREYRKANLKFGLRELQGAHTEANEALLDELAKRDEESGAELVARLVTSWNLKMLDDSSVVDIPCTLENRVAFFGAFEEVALATINKVAEVAETMGKTKAA